MDAPVDHVHHRHWKHVRVRAADVSIERDLELSRPGLRRRQRHRQDRVGPKPALVRGAVGLDHRPIERTLIQGIEALEDHCDLAVHVVDRLLDALAHPRIATVSELGRLVHAGRGPRRRDRSSPCP